MFTDKLTADYTSAKVKDFITADIKTAHVFEKYGIDFCCNGNRPLKEACEEKNVGFDTIISEINSITGTGEKKENRYEEWDLKFLTDYIVNNHHSYVHRAIPAIIPHLEKVEIKHEDKHPELHEIKSIFMTVADEMYAHMMKEENRLFNVIKYLVDCKHFDEKPRINGFGSVKNPIAVMEREHISAGGGMEKIRELTSNFTPPADACNTFKLLYDELAEFEKDLHIHVHLENNILFPKAIKLEEELLHD